MTEEELNEAVKAGEEEEEVNIAVEEIKEIVNETGEDITITKEMLEDEKRSKDFADDITNSVINRNKLGEEAQLELEKTPTEKPKNDNRLMIGTFFLSASAIALYLWFKDEEKSMEDDRKAPNNKTKVAQKDPLSANFN